MQKKKYRVYELAKEFGKTDKEVIEILKAGHVDVTNRLSGVDDNGKSILARHVAAEKKKAAKRPVMRTVRFDQAGQPNGKKGNARQSSYSSYSTEEAAPAEAQKPAQKPAPKAEAPQKEAPKAEPTKAAERPSRPAREASRQDGAVTEEEKARDAMEEAKAEMIETGNAVTGEAALRGETVRETIVSAATAIARREQEMDRVAAMEEMTVSRMTETVTARRPIVRLVRSARQLLPRLR